MVQLALLSDDAAPSDRKLRSYGLIFVDLSFPSSTQPSKSTNNSFSQLLATPQGVGFDCFYGKWHCWAGPCSYGLKMQRCLDLWAGSPVAALSPFPNSYPKSPWASALGIIDGPCLVSVVNASARIGLTQTGWSPQCVRWQRCRGLFTLVTRCSGSRDQREVVKLSCCECVLRPPDLLRPRHSAAAWRSWVLHRAA